MELHSIHLPHDSHAPPLVMPYRTCPRHGHVPGYGDLGDRCPCGLEFLERKTDLYARVIAEQRAIHLQDLADRWG